jgi:RNA polymerase sigma-70 factor (ECF subfamily)
MSQRRIHSTAAWARHGMDSAAAFTHTDTDDRRARFESVYAGNYELILAYALRRTLTRDDAADVVAETFLQVWRRLEQAPEGNAVRLWLYGVARNVLANHLRGKRRYERLGVRLAEAVTVAGARFDVAVDEAPGVVAAAFGRLRPDDQDILALLAVEGLAPREMAEVLRCSATAVRVRLHRARSRFARQLAAQGVEV